MSTATLERVWSGQAVADGVLNDITIGSLCTGYGGLGEAVRSVIGGRHIWVADNDPDAAALLAYRYPDVPNLGDITQVDWTTVPPVDVLESGFPCQDISQAGGRAGLCEDTRSGNIWGHCFRAVAALRPALVVIENVRSLTSAKADSDLEFCPECMGDGSDTMVRALGVVLGDLASIGFDAGWCCVRASDAGAPHKRDRIFILAWPAADSCDRELQRRGAASAAAGGTGNARDPAGGGGRSPADPLGPGLEVRPVEHHGPQCPAAERGGRELPRRDAGVALLPTPQASDSSGGHLEPEFGGRRTSGAKRSASIATAVDHLLKTPTAQLAVNGGSQHPDKRRAGGHGPTLADQVEHEVALLPTPTSTLGSNADAISQAKGREGGTLVEALSLLPTPTAADARNTRNATAGRTEGSVAHSGTTLSDVFHAREVAISVDWGKYEAAIRRWERVFGRAAPCPVRQGKTNYVLAPELPEWMMGLPAGWVTGVPGLTRSAMLKLIGNGVVPQQGALAVRVLLDAIGWLPLRNLLAARALTDHPDPEKEASP